MKSALITGITGQGGAYLAQLLISKGYSVIGTTRDAKQANHNSLAILGLDQQVDIRSLDLQNGPLVLDLIDQLRPDEIYHFAAPSSVARSFQEPAETIYSIALTTANILDAVRRTDISIPCFVATSTEMFGECQEPANVNTPHDPKSPYGIGKSCAHYQARNYRDAYGVFACSGVFSNFESPLRPRNYVTSKIVHGACQIALGEAKTIELGNLNIMRDWGSAEDFVEAAYLALQGERPDDFLIATGITSSLKDFLEITFSCLELDYQDHLMVKNSLLRPLDIRQTQCDISATQTKLAWQPKHSLKNIIQQMIYANLLGQVGNVKAAAMAGIEPQLKLTNPHTRVQD